MNTSALDRFLRYVTFDTRADEKSTTFPSTPGQLTLLRALTDELRALGVDDAVMDAHGYVMARGNGAAGSRRDRQAVVGRRKKNVAPFPNVLSHQIVPLSRVTISFATASPYPDDGSPPVGTEPSFNPL